MQVGVGITVNFVNEWQYNMYTANRPMVWNEIMCKYKYNDMIIYNKVNATKKKNINMIDIVVNK